MIKKFIISFLIVSFNLSFSQNNSRNKNLGTIIVSDLSNAANVTYTTFKKPFEFTNNDWLTVGSIVGGTALLFTLDKNIRKSTLQNKNDFNDKLFNFDSFYGNLYTAFFTSGVYGIGLISGNNRIRQIGLSATEAFILSGLATGLLKVLIGRRRPYAGESNTFFKPFQFNKNDFQALPSGHTTVAFAVSTVMANSIDNTIWKTFWYGSAGMVALSRIYHNKHWLSDVFLGTAVGYFIGDFIVSLNNNNNCKSSNSKISPIFSFNKIGLRYSF